MADCENCPSRGSCDPKTREECTYAKLNAHSRITSVIAVMSGKGGVGKSSLTVLTARELKRRGLKVGILDADITGPSIPRLTDIPADARCRQGKEGILPVFTPDGMPVVSLNFFLDSEETPVVWRGPILSGAVKQFWTDVRWGELDCLLIDMPPGTGDVVLTVMQSMPLSGVLVVSTPHDLSSMVVAKSVAMARMLRIDVLGLVENMAYITCPDCGKVIRLFDETALHGYLQRERIPLLGSLPMLPQVAGLTHRAIDRPVPELAAVMGPVGDRVEELVHSQMKAQK